MIGTVLQASYHFPFSEFFTMSKEGSRLLYALIVPVWYPLEPFLQVHISVSFIKNHVHGCAVPSGFTSDKSFPSIISQICEIGTR